MYKGICLKVANSYFIKYCKAIQIDQSNMIDIFLLAKAILKDFTWDIIQGYK